MMPVAAKSADTPRGQIAWLEAGSGWPLILLHAFPLNAEMWRPQLEAVPAGWRFIAPDLRGFGRTPLSKISGAVTMEDYAADVSALLDRLEIEEAIIGGLSMGGYVTFALHRLAPSRFTGMILADTRPQADTPQGREGRTTLRKVLAADGTAGVASQMLPKLLSADADAALRDRTRAAIESNRVDAIDAAIGAMMDRPDSTPDLARISCATVVLVGDADAITPVADAEAMQRQIQRSTLTVIAGAGHLSNVEQPQAFSRALGDFLLSAL